MLLGSPYQRLVAVNGKALTPEQTGEEKRKLETALFRTEKRIAKCEDQRERDQAMLDEIVKAFDFNEAARGNPNSTVMPSIFFWHLPGQDIVPPNRESRSLTGMQGKPWTDRKTFSWAKVEFAVAGRQNFALRKDRSIFFSFLERVSLRT
jgi:hypothetical protein